MAQLHLEYCLVTLFPTMILKAGGRESQKGFGIQNCSGHLFSMILREPRSVNCHSQFCKLNMYCGSQYLYGTALEDWKPQLPENFQPILTGDKLKSTQV